MAGTLAVLTRMMVVPCDSPRKHRHQQLSERKAGGSVRLCPACSINTIMIMIMIIIIITIIIIIIIIFEKLYSL